ncbi:alpha/beta hydrolase [Helicobacter sp. MIT 21-1697]|uniref:alpha/beta fold hydrolase n=1 Tax=Helicobacter sp. MIT 21-1697 TaxID=2993733 RepID=UPI00224ADFCF|nr:alpha/beta hydrolase [Helicobacter sp. MIT 21-1697]MCX2717572.1 alpha/beta hydrolase [Helicobacter sp. MIT 21-1697]
MAQKRIVYQGEYFELSYEKVKPQIADSLGILETPIMLFLHGWGSNKELMKSTFAQYFNEYEHIYLDMPGFGNSPNENPLTTLDYAHIVEIFIKEVSGVEAKNCIIVGHSFGGKVAVLCQPKEVILLSSAGIRVPKSLKVRLKIIFAKIIGKCGLGRFGKIFRSSDVKAMNEGMYQTFKNVVDEDFSSTFSAYKGKASIFWGKNDSATPLFCGQTIAALISKSRFFPMEGNHYFFLHQGGNIEKLYRSGV